MAKDIIATEIPTETHPFPPFIPENGTVLIAGTFPPKANRWSMPFYYPNRTNDFWKIMGLVFYNNPMRFWNVEKNEFREKDIRNFLIERGIALTDTGHVVRRLKDNASDKFLEIIEPFDLHTILRTMPHCRFIATTGEKAAETLAAITATRAPRIGESVDYHSPDGRLIKIFRMPSTSRAYPLPLEKKAEAYALLMKTAKLV